MCLFDIIVSKIKYKGKIMDIQIDTTEFKTVTIQEYNIIPVDNEAFGCGQGGEIRYKGLLKFGYTDINGSIALLGEGKDISFTATNGTSITVKSSTIESISILKTGIEVSFNFTI